MPTIKQYTKKDGSKAYMFNLYLGVDPITRKKKRTTRRGFNSKKEANLALSKLRLELEDQGIGSINNLSFQEVYDLWIDQHSKEVKITTYDAIVSKFKSRILPKFGHMKINSITRVYCQRIVNEWAQQFKTFNDYKVQTNLVFKYALRLDIIQQNPMDYVTIPKKQNEMIYNQQDEKQNFFSKEELKLFLKTVIKEMDYKTFTIFRLLAFTGARKGEILALHWSDIDFNKKTISFKKTLVETKGKQLLQTPKTPASRRLISIDDETLDVLNKWRTRQIDEYKEVNITLLSDEQQPLFTRYYYLEEKMKLFRLATLNDKLSFFFENHKDLDPITIHGFRHTHASLLFEAGASIKDVQVRLGHTDIQTTMNIYTHVTNSAKEKIANLFKSYMDF